jgi:nucleoside 2-deoxyribosyltransferase
MTNKPILIVGELFCDFTLTPAGSENKLRLGGVAHAARGLWAVDVAFAVAAVCPSYLRDAASSYLNDLGCIDFIDLGEVIGAPNVMVIGDPTEVGDQGYENLLRENKTVVLQDVSEEFSTYEDILVFPGAFDLIKVCQMLPIGVQLHIDIAYDVRSASDLSQLAPNLETLFISTSSDLFLNIASEGIDGLRKNLDFLSPSFIVLKENRGGARIVQSSEGKIVDIPAILGTTVNSVGVGDAFSAIFLNFIAEGVVAAGLKAARVSSAYAQTTFPDVFKKYVDRSLKLSIEQMTNLGGVSLSWEERPGYQIYLAAPDFSYADRRAIDDAVSSLQYHNFCVRRPVQENGELPKNANIGELSEAYRKDIELLSECALVFAIPTDRDPGTLVEIGLAIRMDIPVIVYDPCKESRNTMVIAGSTCYAHSLDECLNAVFSTLSGLRKSRDV